MKKLHDFEISDNKSASNTPFFLKWLADRDSIPAERIINIFAMALGPVLGPTQPLHHLTY
jgi:hypothetical protein